MFTADEAADKLLIAAVGIARGLRLPDHGSRLSGEKIAVLAVVIKAGTLQPSEIAVRANRQKTSVARAVKELLSQGLVERSASTADRRFAEITATPAGHALFDADRTSRIAPISEKLATLSNDEFAALITALPVLQRLAEHGFVAMADTEASNDRLAS